MPESSPHGGNPSGIMQKLLSCCCGGDNDYRPIRSSVVDWRTHPIVQQYLLLKVIGEGGFSEIWLAQHKVTGDKAALKVVYLSQPGLTKEQAAVLEGEAKFLKLLEHPNILACRAVLETKYDLVLVLEHLSGGELLEHLHLVHHYNEATASHLFRQMADVLAYMHGLNIMHRDIKPENLMFARPVDQCQRQGKSLKVKLIDFGMATVYSQTSCTRHSGCLGSPGFIAPEVVKGGHHSPAMDVYALGVVLFVMLTGRKPWALREVQSLQYARHKIQDAPGIKDTLFESCSPSVKELVLAMMADDPDQRPTARQVLRHAWVQGLEQHPSQQLAIDPLIRRRMLQLANLRRYKGLSFALMMHSESHDTVGSISRNSVASSAGSASSMRQIPSHGRIVNANMNTYANEQQQQPQRPPGLPKSRSAANLRDEKSPQGDQPSNANAHTGQASCHKLRLQQTSHEDSPRDVDSAPRVASKQNLSRASAPQPWYLQTQIYNASTSSSPFKQLEYSTPVADQTGAQAANQSRIADSIETRNGSVWSATGSGFSQHDMLLRAIQLQRKIIHQEIKGRAKARRLHEASNQQTSIKPVLTCKTSVPEASPTAATAGGKRGVGSPIALTASGRLLSHALAQKLYRTLTGGVKSKAAPKEVALAAVAATSTATNDMRGLRHAASLMTPRHDTLATTDTSLHGTRVSTGGRSDTWLLNRNPNECSERNSVNSHTSQQPLLPTAQPGSAQAVSDQPQHASHATRQMSLPRRLSSPLFARRQLAAVSTAPVGRGSETGQSRGSPTSQGTEARVNYMAARDLDVALVATALQAAPELTRSWTAPEPGIIPNVLGNAVGAPGVKLQGLGELQEARALSLEPLMLAFLEGEEHLREILGDAAELVLGNNAAGAMVRQRSIGPTALSRQPTSQNLISIEGITDVENRPFVQRLLSGALSLTQPPWSPTASRYSKPSHMPRSILIASSPKYSGSLSFQTTALNQQSNNCQGYIDLLPQSGARTFHSPIGSPLAPASIAQPQPQRGNLDSPISKHETARLPIPTPSSIASNPIPVPCQQKPRGSCSAFEQFCFQPFSPASLPVLAEDGTVVLQTAAPSGSAQSTQPFVERMAQATSLRNAGSGPIYRLSGCGSSNLVSASPATQAAQSLRPSALEALGCAVLASRNAAPTAHRMDNMYQLLQQISDQNLSTSPASPLAHLLQSPLNSCDVAAIAGPSTAETL